MNVGVVVLRLVERVLLDGRDAVDLEQVGDLVRRHLSPRRRRRRSCRLWSMSAAGTAVLIADDDLVGDVRDVLRRTPAPRALLSCERLAGDARARRGETRDAAGVRRGRVEVVLDHHVDRRRVRLRRAATDRSSRARRRPTCHPTNVESGVSAVAVKLVGDAPPATDTVTPRSTTAPSSKPNVLACLTLYPFRPYGRRRPGFEQHAVLSAHSQGSFAADRIGLGGTYSPTTHSYE